MLKSLKNLIGNPNKRYVEKLASRVAEINELEPQMEALKMDEFVKLTGEFKQRINDGETLDEILPEAFAATREVARRTLGMRHFDVQLMGGMALHRGAIAEMGTGEGKTLVATLAAYLNSLATPPVHVVTVNDYLARRDATWMAPIYTALGVSVGCIQSDSKSYKYVGVDATAELNGAQGDTEDKPTDGMMEVSRVEAYGCDVVFGTNNEFAFDFLRDNMQTELTRVVQHGGRENEFDNHRYAIIDEVDNILIDEARTPLIISGPAPDVTQNYQRAMQVARHLDEDEDFEVDGERKGLVLTEEGVAKLEKLLKLKNLYAPENQSVAYYIENALKAHQFYKRDREYVVQNGQVILVDEFTGRLMHGRRLGEGLHQAIEAKERVKVQRGTRTYASISMQNYFRMYDRLAGMTGTAMTEAEELYSIYKLDVFAIPTNKEAKRIDLPDQVYLTEEAKWRAVAEKVQELHKQGIPVLIGTTSIEKSDKLTQILRKRGLKAETLNAKNHEREADIVLGAGAPKALTVSTNMAGRGTDIVLGGDSNTEENWDELHTEVVNNGGLFVLGTERHDSQRIDNQLKGRAGRQGDPGKTQFFLSMEDELVRRFGGDRVKSTLSALKWDENEPVKSGFLQRAINSSQQKVEGFHFEARKHLVDYDDVINEQRKAVYRLRKKVLLADDPYEEIEQYVMLDLEDAVKRHWNGNAPDESAPKILLEAMLVIPERKLLPEVDALAAAGSADDATELIQTAAEKMFEMRKQELGQEDMDKLLRLVAVSNIDSAWSEHLTVMENIRQSIRFEAVGQRNPLTQYQRQSFEMFEDLLARIRQTISRTVFKSNLNTNKAQNNGAPRTSGDGGKTKLGRNDPCTCGSGKKYKKCHGANQ